MSFQASNNIKLAGTKLAFQPSEKGLENTPFSLKLEQAADSTLSQSTIDQDEWKNEYPRDDSLFIVRDTPILENEKGTLRAKKTAPKQVTVADSKIPDAGSGVWAREAIPTGTRFGPYQGKIVSAFATTSPYAWVIRKNGKPHHCVDASYLGLSNWMRYVNCARHDGEQNLKAFQHGAHIYYKTIRPINPNEELLIWYGDEFGRQLGIAADSSDSFRDRVFKCSACPYAFQCPLYLDRHKKFCVQLRNTNRLNGVTGGGGGDNSTCPGNEIKKKLHCPECQEFFFSNRILKIHLKSHAPSENARNKYPQRFSSQASLERIHASPKSCTCLLCDQRFSNAKEFLAHMKNHSRSESVCLLCNKRYSHKYELNRHFKMVHSRSDLNACSLCNKRFACSSHLKRHFLTHTGEKRFVCSLCDKRFTQRGQLNRHVRAHNSVKRYGCPVCLKRFAESHHLKIHERIHSGEKPFGCAVCGKRFSNKENLTVHERQHSGEMPYVCTACDKRFFQRSNFKLHLSKHRAVMMHD